MYITNKEISASSSVLYTISQTRCNIYFNNLIGFKRSDNFLVARQKETFLYGTRQSDIILKILVTTTFNVDVVIEE